MSSAPKDTVYIDVDDEITAVIEKVKASPHRIVALVLPKRATVLQSIVNMKLLKKSAEAGKKQLVLITSEASLLPIAGAVGLHTAKTLQSKPVIPPLPVHAHDDADEVENVNDADLPDPAMTVGELAAAHKIADDDTETVDLDNVETALPGAATVTAVKSKFRGGGKIKVPNFEKFRLRLVIAVVLVILLIVGWVYGFTIMPKATVVIKTDSADISTSASFAAATDIKTFNADQKQVPATYKEVKKTGTQKTTPTGQRDDGTKATGTMTLFYCPASNDTQTVVPAGTVFTSASYTFVANTDVTVPASNFTGGGTCKKDLSAQVAVTAGHAGDSYNLSARTYTLSVAAVSASGSSMSGGTSKVVTVLSQDDLNNAAAKLKDAQHDEAVSDLKKQFTAANLMAVTDSLTISDPAVTADVKVGDVATTANVTAVTTYGMLAVKQDDVAVLVKKSIDGQYNPKQQLILNDGVGQATFHVDTRKDNNHAQITIQSTVSVGPQLDATAIATSIKGMKKGDAQTAILARPGIKDVTITYSPFWVFSTPKSAKKIIVTFEKPSQVKAPAPSPSTGGQTPSGSANP